VRRPRFVHLREGEANEETVGTVRNGSDSSTVYNDSEWVQTAMTEAITLQLPDRLYQRLVHTAQATQRSLEAVVMRALEVGAPPDWDDVPAEFQADVAALDRLDDAALWQMVRRCKTAEDMTRYDELLDRNQAGELSPAERLELTQLRQDADRWMLCKAQAAVILRWRGHQVFSP